MKYELEISWIVFAKQHEFIITPLGWQKHKTQYNKLGSCPCDSQRPVCPCPEAFNEVRNLGHCKCSLFWRNYDTYLAQCFPDQWPPAVVINRTRSKAWSK
jgi:ferredoxin-thioredoxin reductase catalytic subunit